MCALYVSVHFQISYNCIKIYDLNITNLNFPNCKSTTKQTFIHH